MLTQPNTSPPVAPRTKLGATVLAAVRLAGPDATVRDLRTWMRRVAAALPRTLTAQAVVAAHADPWRAVAALSSLPVEQHVARVLASVADEDTVRCCRCGGSGEAARSRRSYTCPETGEYDDGAPPCERCEGQGYVPRHAARRV